MLIDDCVLFELLVPYVYYYFYGMRSQTQKTLMEKWLVDTTSDLMTLSSTYLLRQRLLEKLLPTPKWSNWARRKLYVGRNL